MIIEFVLVHDYRDFTMIFSCSKSSSGVAYPVIAPQLSRIDEPHFESENECVGVAKTNHWPAEVQVFVNINNDVYESFEVEPMIEVGKMLYENLCFLVSGSYINH